MQRRFDAILFDFDGTVADTGEGIFASAVHAAQALGFPAPTAAQLRRFVGPPLLESFQTLIGMTPDQAKAELLKNLKDEVAHESAAIIRDSEARTKAEADKTARSILSLAMQRIASDHTVENTVSTIQIPSDDLKGRIIGREGRNIRSFEQITGTNLIIDDTPECVTISCFDPVRREIGRVTMENLISDGRIHPARIEEMFGKAEKLVNQRVQEAGEQATFDTGIHDLHP